MCECQFCYGPLVPLGTLGHLLHGRCRDCGTVQSIEVPDWDDDEWNDGREDEVEVSEEAQ